MSTPHHEDPVRDFRKTKEVQLARLLCAAAGYPHPDDIVPDTDEPFWGLFLVDAKELLNRFGPQLAVVVCPPQLPGDVEAAARVLCSSWNADDPDLWEELDQTGQDGYRAIARAALGAALMGQPTVTDADRTPLPEDWVLYTYLDGAQTILWHSDGTFSRFSDGGGVVKVEHPDRLTPLRPAVTEADVEKAARAARAAYFDSADHWDKAIRLLQREWKKTIRAAFEAVEIEVSDR